MRKFIVALVVSILSLSAFGQYVPAQRGQTYKKHVGQTVSSAPPKSHAGYVAKTEGKAAWSRNDFSYYIPSDLRSYSKNPVDGVTSVLMPIENDAIVKMPIVGGVYYVIIKAGTNFRWYKDSNGCIADKPYALDACGNAILDFEYLVSDKAAVKDDVPVNNYSEKPAYNQPYKKPNDYNYCNGYKQVQDPVAPYTQNRKGWSTGKKILVGVAVAAVAYTVYALATKSRGSESHDQVVVTGGASYAPSNIRVEPVIPTGMQKKPSFGLTFGIGI